MGETGIKTWALTGAEYATDLHLLRGGTRWGCGAPTQTRDALSGDVKVGAPILEMVRLNLFPVDVNCLLDLVLPEAIGELPPDVPLTVGNAAQSGGAWKINLAEAECEAGGALQLGYELVNATQPTYGAGSTPTEPVRTTFEWYRGSAVGETAKAIRAVKFKIGNNIQPVHSLNLKSTLARYPDSIEPGALTVDAEVEYLDDPGIDPGADELPTADITLVCINAATLAVTITIAATGMVVPNWYFEPGGKAALGRYTVPYESHDNALSGITITVAEAVP
jgi:hypothetical protein